MTDPMTTPMSRVDALLAMKPTTPDAVELTRRLVQKHATDDADRVRVLAELGIEGTDD